jgi:hypothetical protein
MRPAIASAIMVAVSKVRRILKRNTKRNAAMKT